ncbi:MAG: nucleotidyltransferase domain-containing protein [Pseudonocardiaceae bacterium]
MARVPVAVVDGKARYNGRALADWVPAALERIVAAFAPVRVILFGSVARGDDGPDSDIDLLVVLHEIPGRRHDAAVAVLRALRDLPPPVDVLVTDPRRIAETGDLPGVLRVALREGRVVHDRAARDARRSRRAVVAVGAGGSPPR